MWQFDFHLYYMAARAILEGTSPYQILVYYGPYPLAIFFIPFALLPEPVAYFTFIAANIALAWKLFGLRKGLWALCSFPVIYCLFAGQIDFLLTMLVLGGSPWTLGLVIIKPQIGFVLIPWFLRKFKLRDYLKAMLPAIILLAISFILRPSWVQEWLAGSPGMQKYSEHASNFYWTIPLNWRTTVTLVGAAIVFPLGFYIKERSISWSLLSLFSPLSNIYSPSVLAEWIGPLEFLLSWAAIFLVGGKIHSGAPLFIVGLAIIIKTVLKNRGYSLSFEKEPGEP